MRTRTEIRSLALQFLGLIQESFISKYFCESVTIFYYSEFITETNTVFNFTDFSNSQSTATAERKSEIYPNRAGFPFPSAS